MNAATTYGRDDVLHTAHVHHGPRGRFSLEAGARLAVSALVVVAAIVIVLAIFEQAEPPAPEAWSAVSVGQAGTLWQIAAEHRIEGLSTDETVDVIREKNGLESSLLYAGQTLVVPDTSSGSLSLAQR